MTLRNYLLKVDLPHSTIRWLGKSKAIPVLQSLVDGSTPLTHEALDTYGRNKWIMHLRELLTTAGLLPSRDLHLSRLEERVRDCVATAHPDDAMVLDQFMRWKVLRRLRQEERTKPISFSAAANARSQMYKVQAFLEGLRTEDLTLASVDQNHIDRLVVADPIYKWALPGFITWARKNSLCGDIHCEQKQRGQPNVTLNEVERWHLIEKLLNADSMRLHPRVAGLLVLLYGQTLSRICRLRLNELQFVGESVYLMLGRRRAIIPPPVDQLVIALTSQRGKGSYSSEPTEWLFPGALPGRHMQPNALGRTLREFGMNSIQGRNIALYELAKDMPEVVLSDAVGLNPDTASAWAALAGRTYATYPDLRHEPHL